MVVKDCGHFPAATIVLLSKELNLEFSPWEIDPGEINECKMLNQLN